MDIKTIKQIVNSNLPLGQQEKAILSVLANDKKVIPYIMEILDNEREQNKELLLDTNLELSRALITLTTNSRGKKAMKEQTEFVVGEIKKHYIKWKEYKETPKEMAAKIRQSFSEHCKNSLNDDAIFTTERAEKECALIYIKGIIENAYIKWLMPEDNNNPFLKYWNEVEKEVRK